jgi:hypothetical protein
MNPVSFQQNATVEVARKSHPALPSSCVIQGNYRVEHWRKGRRLNEMNGHNGISVEGKNYLFDVMFGGVTANSVWYIGLIDLSGYSALSENDTYDNLNQAGNGWDWYTTYTDANNADSTITRPVWSAGASSGKAITNATPAIFDITTNGTVKGIFVCAGTNGADKTDHSAGTAHKLWATALFTADVAVQTGDQLKVTYTVSAPATT